ncbi:MAG: hypothetical protein ACI805_001341 [Candidatus Azotimanducaceae bacterium]|jgi:uncharacterized protein (TIGR00299 family) protein
MHIHLDLVGGISGDMFIAAALDCFPEFADELPLQIERAGFPGLVELESGPHNDGILSGYQFSVKPAEDAEGHHHRHYSEIRTLLKNSSLDEGTQDIAQRIFHIIAVAEAAIHDKPVEHIAFHEVGAWDSIADIVCASFLIDKIGITSCSCSALPLGGGQVKTAHGMLPIPAPATALILKGFEFVDDGIQGERITPTGAAILKYLAPASRPSGHLVNQGFGFGTKKFPRISNALRMLVLDASKTSEAIEMPWHSETIHQFEFEIDDQTPEQLAAAIDQIHETQGVLDIIQYAAYGKKNRLCHGIRILFDGKSIDDLATRCFQLTTTLGLRHTQVQRHILNRQMSHVSLENKQYRVKIADRPGGKTIKAEMEDLKQTESFAKQANIRRRLESLDDSDL